jgi:hypothetical protein
MDGWVYCLDAIDGGLVWRFRAAPEERRIVAFGQLESPWPVHGSVLVDDGIAFCTAGRSSYLDGGIYVYALNVDTGEMVHEARMDGPFPTLQELRQGVDARYKSGLVMDGSLNDIFVSDGRRLYMFFNVFDYELDRIELPPAGMAGQRDLGTPHLIPSGGFTDTSLFNREYWTYSRYWWFPQWSKLGGLAVVDDQHVHTVQFYRRPEYLQHKLYSWVEGGDPALLLTMSKNTGPQAESPLDVTYPAEKQDPDWQKEVPLLVRAMVKAGDRLFLAGIPSEYRADDPLGAFEGRREARLWVCSGQDGARLAQVHLPAAPVFDGMAAADGGLFISLRNGQMVKLEGK